MARADQAAQPMVMRLLLRSPVGPGSVTCRPAAFIHFTRFSAGHSSVKSAVRFGGMASFS